MHMMSLDALELTWLQLPAFWYPSIGKVCFLLTSQKHHKIDLRNLRLASMKQPKYCQLQSEMWVLKMQHIIWEQNRCVSRVCLLYTSDCMDTVYIRKWLSSSIHSLAQYQAKKKEGFVSQILCA